ncbi:5-(carboxyamino)imidazole ribonucleotide mutase [Thermophagus xiamenensis]|uniref:N5-carboxyaminoimidazole ribonucleotide mutase n=2 Tax=Thermophagus xiamenensis TaxID=385682 RepID=A0A1I1ZJ81_9BACT|nr:5-(carboxyamino)imidazole ribonucleotide mutase [Thermophagus xiamenensis]
MVNVRSFAKKQLTSQISNYYYKSVHRYTISDKNLLHKLHNIKPKTNTSMNPLVSIIMGSTSDLAVMEKAAKVLNDFQIPFEINALSAHRTPDQVMQFAREAYGRGIRVIIAGAGGAAHLPGVIAALTPIPVIGVPIKASISIDGWDSILSILQMPPGIPVATVGLDGAQNAGILAAQILGTGDKNIYQKVETYKASLSQKIEKANQELATIKFDYKTN